MSKRAPGGAKDSPARPLVKARNERKAAQVDMQALENRIALLKKEEQRAHLRIKETRNRASHIMKIREDNLQLKRQLAAADPGKYNADVRRQQVQDRQLAAEMSRKQRDQKMNSMLNQKQHLARQCKREKQDLERRLHQQQERDLKAAREKTESVKAAKAKARKQRQKKDRARRAANKAVHTAKVEQEKALRRQAAGRIKHLEREEMELINRLQSTQELQRRAFEQLEEALDPAKYRDRLQQAGEASAARAHGGGR